MIWRRDIYLLFYSIAFLFIHLMFFFLPRKTRQSIQLKWTTQLRKNNFNWSERPICIHAASGEVEYAKSLMRELKRTFPRLPIILTYSSPSISRLIANFREIDLVTAAPFDLPWTTASFLQKFNPQLVLYARTDVWPEFASQCAKHNIPQILFSATFAENSSRLSFFGKFFSYLALKPMNEIHCVSREDQQTLLEKLGIASEVSGDTRYDQVFYRLFHEKQNQMLNVGFSQFAVFGSTWPEDDLVLLKALPRLIKAQLRVVWVPHEVEIKKVNQLKNTIQTMGFQVALASENSDFKNLEVLIVDKVGLLAEIYTRAQWAFVGGSFRKQVHSVMEPLACGLRVLVGPCYKNNREAVAYSLHSINNLPIVSVVKSADELTERVQQIQRLHLSQDRLLIKSLMEKQMGGSQKILEHCRRFLRSKSY